MEISRNDTDIDKNKEVKLWDFLPEFLKAFEVQLKKDDKRWGDTWLNRPRLGQEDRFVEDIRDYYDKFKHGGQPMPWLKVIGNAYIAWVRETHQELSEEW